MTQWGDYQETKILRIFLTLGFLNFYVLLLQDNIDDDNFNICANKLMLKVLQNVNLQEIDFILGKVINYLNSFSLFPNWIK